MMEINSADMPGTVSQVQMAKMMPYFVVLRVKRGMDVVGQMLVSNASTSAEAHDDMYNVFAIVNRIVDNDFLVQETDVRASLIMQLMAFARGIYGDVSFSVVALRQDAL